MQHLLIGPEQVRFERCSEISDPRRVGFLRDCGEPVKFPPPQTPIQYRHPLMTKQLERDAIHY